MMKGNSMFPYCQGLVSGIGQCASTPHKNVTICSYNWTELLFVGLKVGNTMCCLKSCRVDLSFWKPGTGILIFVFYLWFLSLISDR